MASPTKRALSSTDTQNESHRTNFVANQRQTMIRRLSLALLWATAAAAEESCERLKASLTYTQEAAPRDLSSVVCREHYLVF